MSNTNNTLTMTSTLANELMNNLACLAFSAMGGVPIDKNGDLDIPEELIEKVSEYAKTTFVQLCEEWENATGKVWNITTDTDEE
jgi:hypothetical protein